MYPQNKVIPKNSYNRTQQLTLLFLIVVVSCSSAFSMAERRNQQNSMLAMVNDQRSFLDATALAGYTFFTSVPAFANTIDLSMPTEEERKDLQEHYHLCHYHHHLCHCHHHLCQY